MKKGIFGADLSMEFYAPSVLLSRQNEGGLKTFFGKLLRDIEMDALSDIFFCCEEDHENPLFNGPTLLQAIKTSSITMHLWPELGPGDGLGYGRLTISTCKPRTMNEAKVIRRLERSLDANVFHRSRDEWVGPFNRKAAHFKEGQETSGP